MTFFFSTVVHNHFILSTTACGTPSVVGAARTGRIQMDLSYRFRS